MDAALFANDHTRPALQILVAWLSDAWRLFRRAPIRMFLLSLLPIAVEILIQVLPGAGIVLSKLLTPLASAWALALLHSKASHGRFAPAEANGLWVSRLAPLLLVSLLSACVFMFQLMVATALGGVDEALALGSGDVANLHFNRVELGCTLASGMLPGALLMFLMPRVLLDGVGAGQALIESARCAVRYWRPVAMVSLLAAGLLGGMLWLPPLLLVLLPFATSVAYTSYRDVFDRTRLD